MKHESPPPSDPLRIVSLFSGIGGFEVGLHRSGHQTILMCEADDAARAVLRHRFPDIDIADDVRTLPELPACDLITAGWPCQDISPAGGTKGLAGANSSLIEHVFRLLSTAADRPRYVLLENVAFALDLKGGEAVRYVTEQLSALGYRWAYRILDTRMFGLPQRRRRLYVLACREEDPATILFDGLASLPIEDEADPRMVGFYWTEGTRGLGWSPDAVPPLKGGSGLGIPSPPAIWDIANVRFMLPTIGDAERLQGFSADWTIAASTDRKTERRRWQLVGNAVSVPVAEWIGRRLGRRWTDRELLPEGRPSERLPRAASGGPSMPTMGFAASREGPSIAKLGKLSDFKLADGPALSQRALIGFTRRYQDGSLRQNPRFLADLHRCQEVAASR